MGKKVLVIAGEASGDLHGANLVKAIRTVDPSIIFWGVGGRHMQEVRKVHLEDNPGLRWP